MFKLDLEKAEEPKIIASIHWVDRKSIEKTRESQKNIYFCFTDYGKIFDCVDHNKLWKILKEKGIQDHLTCLLQNLYASQEATVGTRHGTMDWFQIGKEYIKAVYCHPAYLTYMKSISWEMLNWMKHKLESRLPREISVNLRYADDTTPMAESEEELKSLLMKVKKKSEKLA